MDFRADKVNAERVRLMAAMRTLASESVDGRIANINRICRDIASWYADSQGNQGTGIVACRVNGNG